MVHDCCARVGCAAIDNHHLVLSRHTISNRYRISRFCAIADRMKFKFVAQLVTSNSDRRALGKTPLRATCAFRFYGKVLAPQAPHLVTSLTPTATFSGNCTMNNRTVEDAARRLLHDMYRQRDVL